MTKVFCDACGRELGHPLHTFKYLVHLDKKARLDASGWYEDREGNRSSGRYVEQDLCLKCYNRVMRVAVIEFEKIQSENEIVS